MRSVDFRLGERSDTLRNAARAFLDEALTDDMVERLHATGSSFDRDFHRQLSERGYLAPGWPAELGGQDLDPLEALAVLEEFVRRDAPTNGASTTMMIAGVLREVGTKEQQEEFVRKALSGDIVIVLGFSEPDAGSDVFAARTRAVRNGASWVINGQKMFTTNAEVADYVFLLARSGSTQPKHAGLTTFLVPMNSDGVEVHAVETMAGERTNITYYNDVEISDAYRIGEIDGGYAVMGVALTIERGHAYGAELERLLDFAESWAFAPGVTGGRPVDDPDVLDRLGALAIDAEVATLLARRTTWLAATGSRPGVEASMGKLFGTEALSRNAAAVLDAMGPASIRARDDPLAPARGLVDVTYRRAQAAVIYGGTSEVQRGIIAERGLGLPRST